MEPVGVRHRRARREDFEAIGAILAASGLGGLPARRTDLRRFRRLIADLGDDFYVALVEDRLVGFVHVSYVRQILQGPRARIEALCVAPEARRRGVGASLAALARGRARRRGCAELDCCPPSNSGAGPFLSQQGWRAVGEVFRFDLDRGAQ